MGAVALIVSLLAVFVGGGSLPVALVLWAGLGAFALVDLVLSRPRGAQVTFDFPSEIFVGETRELTLEVTPAAAGLKARLNWPSGLKGPDEIGFERTDAMARASIACRAVRRGTWALNDIWLFWPSRLGLFEFLPKSKLGLEIKVVPNIRLVQSGQITTTVNSTLFGSKENRAIGDGSEFHQLRDFVSGMDVNSIDWKRSARHRSLVAKELRSERNHHVIIALDNGYLMREEIAGLPKIDHAITAALATAWAAAIGGDLVGYLSYDVRPRVFSKPEPGRAAFARLRSRTADLDYVGHESNHTLAMTALNARTPKRSLIIVFTDFIDTTSAELLVENLSILVRRHLVIFVTIRDPDLEAMASSPPDSMDAVSTLVASGQSLAERRLVFERLARLGVTVIDTEPGKITAKLISTYLEIKSKELL